MLKHLSKLKNESGDTIVEVMLVVAILGLAFSVSYAIANQSIIKSRNAQEHSEALQYLNSQVELLRNTSPDVLIAANTAGPFCIDIATNNPVLLPNASCSQGTAGRYQLSINYAAAGGQDRYTFRADWTGVSNLGVQKETISYKLHAL